MLKSSNRFDKLNEFMTAFSGGQTKAKKDSKREKSSVSRDPTTTLRGGNINKAKLPVTTPRKGQPNKTANLYL